MKKLKQIPSFKTDEEAENFVDTANLSEYDFSDFRPMQFKFEKPANPGVGETFDSFLQDEGIADSVTTTAIARMRSGRGPQEDDLESD